MTSLAASADAVLASPAIAGTGRRLGRRRLRVLAYHGVADPRTFRSHLRILRRHYQPVTVEEVLAAVRGTAELPPLAVWVTFDDGDPSVVDNALPELVDAGIQGTMFVCPGVIDTRTAYWWQVAQLAEDRACVPPDLPPTGVVAALKLVDDEVRQAAVAEMATTLEDRGVDVSRRQLSTAELRRFVEAGGAVGNHTWTHPLLDKCDPSIQTDQIGRAHEWLAENVPEVLPIFAYPNGNHTAVAESVLERLGYTVGVLFDHRLWRPGSTPLRISRLRANDRATPERFASIVAGTHGPVSRVVRRLTGR